MTPPVPDDPILLIVDDDVEMRAVLRDVLVGAGFLAEEAADTDELLRLVPRVEPAAIILDHEMPGDWGLEVLPRLRMSYPDVPVLLITAFGGPRTRETALRLGAAAYLDKPFQITALLDAVRRVLASSDSRADHTTGSAGPAAGRGRWEPEPDGRTPRGECRSTHFGPSEDVGGSPPRHMPHRRADDRGRPD